MADILPGSHSYSFDVEGARKTGYADSEIANFLARQSNLDIEAARKAGYSDGEIITQLSAKPIHDGGYIVKPAAKSALDQAGDFAKQTIVGAKQTMAGVADQVAPFVGAAGLGRISTGNPFGLATPANAVGNLFTRALGPQEKPDSAGGEMGLVLGHNLLNGLAPGSVPARIANVAAPWIGGNLGRMGAKALGAGETGQNIAETGGSLMGAGAASMRLGNPFAAKSASPVDTTARALTQRGGVDPAEMTSRANVFSDAGVTPSAVDVIGDKGRRFVKAVGVKNADAGEVLSSNARTVVAGTKPAVMDRTQNLGPMRGTTADELSSAIETARTNAATTNYAEPYKAQVPIDDAVKSALSDGPGQAALQRALRAAVARRETAQVDEINGLINGRATQTWPKSVSGATLDRIQIALGKQAERLTRNQGGDIASGLSSRRSDINGVLDNTPGLEGARADFHSKSQALDVLGKGQKDPYATDPRDYATWLQGLSPEAKTANAVRIRQDILNTLGGQRSGTFGTVDELASSPYSRSNLRQALGPEADQYIAHLDARLQQARNAMAVDAGRGSQTAPLANDMLKGVMQGAPIAKDALHGNVMGVVMRLADWFHTKGMSDADAKALAEHATDPAKLPEIMAAIQKQFGAAEARRFLSARNAALIGGSTLAAGAGQSSAALAGQPTPQR